MKIATPFMLNLVVVTILMACGGCWTPARPPAAPAPDLDVRACAENWLDIYAERRDWGKFLDCYSDKMKFEDQRVRKYLDGRKAFAEFYDWPDERFRLADPDKPALVVHQLVVEGRTAVARGRLLPFYWGEESYDFQDEFVFWVEFDERGKIVFQRDYIPYPKGLLPD